ncbi:alpha/beta hydrolase [Pusillimonas caeni]|uniref:alpha/beta hydrolase n=1 Tax=Pusillimonas caeni TaxID=1348472 RepID=UPI001430B464|nr:alpha/beta hydrolase [Pusillimonas caeni]
MLESQEACLELEQKAEQLRRDAAYNNRRAVIDHEEHLALWDSMSRETRESAHCLLDVPYGDTPRQMLDIFLPANQRPPLIVFLHGGYWMSMSKDSYSFLAKNFVREGIAFACIGFDNCPEASIKGIVGQTQRATTFLYENADALGLDPSRFYLCGHSSGGHLAAMLLSTRNAECSVPPIQGALIVSGLFDLEPIRHTYINKNLRLTKDSVHAVSPIKLAKELDSIAPHLILGVGGLELPAYHQQLQSYVAALRGMGQSLDVIVANGYHHFDVLYDMAGGALFEHFKHLIKH